MHIAFAIALALAFAQQSEDSAVVFAPQSQDPTVVANAHLLYSVEGRGVQIYNCGQQDAVFQWIFKAPEAKLFDPATQEQVGTHGAGPTWTWKDGSSIAGKVIAKFPSPDATSIPWLLLETHPVAGPTGALSKVTRGRRSETHGGNAPATGCDQSHAGETLQVPYTATYTFYSEDLK